MPGDFSRNSLSPPKHYSGVLMQQGRVQVDADWNEQLALQQHRTFTETRDVIGPCGTPKNENGFLMDIVPGGGDLLIEPGRFYVDGLLCELDPQRVAVTFPAAEATSPPPSKSFFHGSSRGIKIRQFQTGAQAHWSDPQGQVNVPSLSFDDRDLCFGDWVELSSPSVATPLKTTIVAIGPDTAASDPNSITPNYYTLTLNDSVAAFQNAGVVWLRRVVTFITQPFLHSPLDASLEAPTTSGASGEVLQLADGDYLVTIEAWQREVDALEDPHIREVALGGPDTAERLQTVWQVHVVPYSTETSGPGALSPPSNLDCCGDFPGWDEYKASVTTTGRMNAQAPPPGDNVPPCLLPPSAGYLGLANQLYRVEIFRSGEYNNTATFVWSRDNAMVETPIVCVDSSGVVYVNDLGKDDLHSFSQNDWVEIFDLEDELLGSPRFLAQITNPTGSQEVPPCAAPGAAQAYNLTLSPAPTKFSGRSNLRLRRWDMPSTGSVVLDNTDAAIGVPISAGWIPIENNISVNFTAGHYASRSFWQIPARTATGDIEWPPFQIPNTNPIAQPPQGVAHYFCRLAILTVTDGAWNLTDCRCRFPSLTDICADDICYHGDGCEVQPVGTVQQALEEIGARIRFQNRMLHGWGVVCGLRVECAEGTSVWVDDGYAIDCEGNDLILKTRELVDFSNLITLSPLQTSINDGDYELILEKPSYAQTGAAAETSDEACCSKSPAISSTGACFSFRAIECETQSFGNDVLNGTLLLDFYNKCLKTLFTAFQESYLNSFVSSDDQVTNAQALLSSLLNLVYQIAQPATSADVFVSAQEHAILLGFYNWLLPQINDRTFCSLSEEVPGYPPYNVNGAMTTIFGKGFSTRLRLSPKGVQACAVGSDNNIYLYDLQSRQLAAVVQLPAPANVSGWTVQDVAFDNTGGLIYAIATTSNDSQFAIGTLNQNPASVSWISSRSLGALPFTAMVPNPDIGGVLVAVAAGQGVYMITINPAPGTTGITQVTGLGTPVGHLISSGKSVYVTTNSGTGAAPAGSFDQIQQILVTTFAQTFTLPAGFSGNLTDDILAENQILWATATSQSAGKELFQFIGDGVVQSVPLNDNTTVRLAFNSALQTPLITFEDTCRVQQLNFANGPQLSPYCPTELHPNSIAVDRNQQTYVFNSTASTISVIPPNMAPFTDFSDLETYRNQAIEAFLQAAWAILQKLKDCFCDLLLVDCRTCDPKMELGTGVPLACVTFRNGSVYKICNLEKRKYVKSFPTVGYWLSLIPVIPLVKVAFEKFCCLILPSLFAKYTVPTKTSTNSFAISPVATRKTLSDVQGFRTNQAVTFGSNMWKSVLSFAGDAILSPFRPSATKSTVAVNNMIGQPVASVQKTLAASNISVVAVTPYEPAKFAENVIDFTRSPSSLSPGSSVTLVTDSLGNVKYYIPSTPAVTQINTAVQANQQKIANVVASSTSLQSQVGTLQQTEASVTEVKGLQTLVTTLQTQLTDLQTTNAAALAQRDQQIATLTANAQQMQARLQTVDQLAAQVKELSSRLPPPLPPRS